MRYDTVRTECGTSSPSWFSKSPKPSSSPSLSVLVCLDAADGFPPSAPSAFGWGRNKEEDKGGDRGGREERRKRTRRGRKCREGEREEMREKRDEFRLDVHISK